METYLNLSEIIIAIVLIVIILMQVRGQGSGVFGSGQASFRTPSGSGANALPVHHRTGGDVRPHRPY